MRCRWSDWTIVLHGRDRKPSHAMYELRPTKGRAHCDAKNRKGAPSGRVVSVGGDFFVDPLPEADVITMGMTLHDWNLEKKKVLVRKAYDALPTGSTFVVIEALIDDARRETYLVF